MKIKRIQIQKGSVLVDSLASVFILGLVIATHLALLKQGKSKIEALQQFRTPYDGASNR